MNRDEAERCVDLALAAVQRGDTARAQRLLRRSLAMHPTERARSLLLSLEAETSTTPPPPPPPDAQDAPPQEQQQQQEQPQQEDDEDVVRVLRCSEDYYAVFGMERSATTEEIKKRYRRLALKMHPDRNSSPHAEDAFKVLGRAYACLSSEEKRRVYDTQGIDPDAHTPPPRRAGARPAAYTFRRGPGTAFAFGDDVDADDLFRFFFGVPPGMGDPLFATMFGTPFGVPRTTRVYTRRRQPHFFRSDGDSSDSDDGDGSNNGGDGGDDSRTRRGPQRRGRRGQQGGLLGLVHTLLPLALLLLLFVLLTRGLGSAAAEQQRVQRLQREQREQQLRRAGYSLQRLSTHPYEQHTAALDVRYFTPRAEVNPHKRERIERDVNEHYLRRLQRDCDLENAQQMRGMRTSGDGKACQKMREKSALWARSKKTTEDKKTTSS